MPSWDDTMNSASIGFNGRGTDNRDGTRSMSREGWQDLRNDIQDRLADEDLDDTDRRQLQTDRAWAAANLRREERAEPWAERNGHNQ